MFLQILGFTVGLLYLWWEYHANSKVWLASVIMPAISMWIYFSKGLYADFGINIYYLLIAVYGYWNWTRKAIKASHSEAASSESVSASSESERASSESESVSSESERASSESERASSESERASSESKSASEIVSDSKITSDSESSDTSEKDAVAITHTPLKVWGLIIVASATIWWLIWWILVTFTDSNVPVADAFTTALSIVGLWMMAKKYAEQWLIWLVVDLVCSCLYWYKGIPFYCILYAIYTVIAYFGYRKWLRLIPTDNKASKP